VTPRGGGALLDSKLGNRANIPNIVAVKAKGFIILIMNIEEILKTYKATPQVIETVTSIKNRYKESGLTVENVSLALMQVMLEVNKLKKLKKTERKQLIITLLNKIVEEVCPGEDTHLEAVLKQMVPNLIDSINEIKTDLKCKCF
jgi:hypothetical protein